MADYPVALLNSTNVTTDGLFVVNTILFSTARYIVDHKSTISYVDNQSAAETMEDILGIDVPCSQESFYHEPGQLALVLSLNEKPPEGFDLSREQLEDIGYVFKTFYREVI